MNLNQRLFTRFCFATAALVLPTIADNARADDMGVVGDSYGVGTPTTSGLAGASALASPDLSTGQVRATYSFHLNTARGASQPSLQLSYRSDGPVAEAGRGWTLGMGGIERRGSPWPNYQNPAPGTALSATFSDRFFFADEPLVPICTVGVSTCPEGESMPTWAVGWHYFRLQREGMFARFFWSSDPKHWRIQMKNGETIELDGLRVDPRFPSATTPAIRRWDVVRRYDVDGNDVVYLYDLEGRLVSIFDTSSLKQPTSLPDYAHHVRLRYDADHNYLSQVDVASAAIDGGGPRELVRRYYLAYDDQSRLAQVQEEGQCASPILEQNGSLPSTNCHRLPPTTFAYSHAEIQATPTEIVPGGGGFGHGGTNANINILDLNSDGLPDVYEPADSPTHSPIVHINVGGASWKQTGAGILFPSIGANAQTILDRSKGVSLLGDWLGDGRVNLLWSAGIHNQGPNACIIPYATYSPRLVNGRWLWAGGDSGSTIDICILEKQRQAGVTSLPPQVADLNGDGLADILALALTPGSTKWLQLQRMFSTKSPTGITPALQHNSPWVSTSLSVDDPSITQFDLEDMDADGVVDLVRVHDSGVVSWSAGDGTGAFSGETTVIGSPGVHPGVVLDYGPHAQWFVHDLTGDGRADLILADDLAGIVVWENLAAGYRLAAQLSAQSIFAHWNSYWGTPFGRVTFADMNGSGVDDIVLILGSTISYIDLLAGKRSGLLTQIGNSVGETTEFEYQTTVQLSTAARAAGHPWSVESPQSMYAVTRRIVRSALAGRPEARVTEYSYQDPAYDGWEKRFRGFRAVRETTIGDANSPTSATDTSFFIGPCQDASNPCRPDTLDDDPLKTVASLPVLVEESDGQRVYLSTRHFDYQLDDLYRGIDGRTVRFAHPRQVDTYLYDTAAFDAKALVVHLPDIEQTAPSGGSVTLAGRDIRLRASAGREHLRIEFGFDRWGNELSTVDHGRIHDDGSRIDAPVNRFDTRAQIGASGWQWGVQTRNIFSFVGTPGMPNMWGRQFSYTYDSLGHLTDIRGVLIGTLPLLRSHESGGATAPLPADASHDGTVVLLHRDYGPLGNLSRTTFPNARCEDVAYDPVYAQLPVARTGYANGCGGGPLTTAHRFDRGLEVAKVTWSASGATTTSTFDGHGRLSDIRLADELLIGMPAAAVAFHADYVVAAGQPIVMHAVTTDASGPHEAWSYVDGLGQKVFSLRQADPSAGDGGAWLATGLSDRAANGQIYRTYLPWFQDGLAVAGAHPPSRSESVKYDAFGRVVEMRGTDNVIVFQRRYHALSVDHHDAEDLNQSGVHFGTPTTTEFDGHAREITRIERAGIGGARDTLTTRMFYQATGELGLVVRSHSLGASTVARWMRHDSLGRLVENAEPNSTAAFAADPQNTGAMRAWRYAYNDNGDLVATSDARGCGKNIARDSLGRVISEDFSPCLKSQAIYTAPQAGGEGTESFYVYDGPEQGQTGDYGVSPSALKGRLAASRDLGAHTRFGYDGRGRVVGMARRMAKPAPDASQGIDARYTLNWFRRAAGYDGAGRVVVESTGAAADVPALLGQGGASEVRYTYSARGTPRALGSSYGPLVDKMVFEADGQIASREIEDAARTTIKNQYDTRRRLLRMTVARSAPDLWNQQSGDYSPPSPNISTQGVILDLGFGYDLANNPTNIKDLRTSDDWPAGAKPVSRRIQYDDLYRATRVDYGYDADPDMWTSPFAAEEQRLDNTPMPAQKTSQPMQRAQWQTFAYDWLGNTSNTQDDADVFLDRSLGQIRNGIDLGTGGPEQLIGAGVGGNGAYAEYDVAGELANLAVVRGGACTAPNGKCSHRFHYDWDEVGELVRARRWDYAPGEQVDLSPLPAATPAIDLAFRYSGGQRVLKSVTRAGVGDAEHTVFIFPSLRLDRTQYDGSSSDYERTADTETIYLAGVARVAPARSSLPHTTTARPRVLFEIQDDLGSTAAVIDRDTGELIERQTYQPFGATETDYRPERWGGFRESYRFTGKEDDVEVGLTYFGARYFHAALGRWISPDPATVHGLGADLNPYAYVHGRVMSAVDPIGLCEGEDCDTETPKPTPPTCVGDQCIVQLGGGGGHGGGGGSGPVHSGCNGPCPPPRPPPPCECGTYAQAQAWARSNPLMGIAFGGVTVITPGGWLMPAPPNTNSNFRFGIGAAQMAAGMVMIILGTVGEIGGITLDATGIGAVLGVPAGVVSAAICVQGAGLITAGALNMSSVDPKALGPAAGGTPGLSQWLKPDKSDYRGRYQQWLRQQGKEPLPEGWDAHHRIPQQYRDHPEFKNFDFDAPQNIRGVSSWGNGPGNNVHGTITKQWTTFKANNQGATRAQIEEFASQLDREHGGTYWPLE